MQVNLSPEMPNDHWNIVIKRKYIFSSVWNEIQLHANRYVNYKLIWHNTIARKFSFTTFMAYIQCLSTTNRLIAWGMSVNLQCDLCKNYNESHQHIFMECKFSTYLWPELLIKLELQPTLDDSSRQQISTLRRKFTTKSASQHSAYVAAATTVHYIWLERI